MTISKKLFFFSLFVFFLFSSAKIVLAEENTTSEIPPPTILETAEIKEINNSQIMVKGLVSGENQVLIYINGEYKGLANISQGNGKFSLFSYLSSPLKNIGNFKVFAIAQDKISRNLSAPTENIVSTIIEKSVLSSVKKAPETIRQSTTNIIPPLLLTPNQKFCENKPYISGFSQNNTLVKIFINKKLYNKFLVVNKSSSTAFFSYVPNMEMDRGQYSVYATAEDTSGNKSAKSNILNFCISRPQTISSSTIKIQENEQDTTDSQLVNSTSTDSAKVFQKTLANNSSSTSEQKSPNQKINLILFIIFVIIIITWMIVVNKNLLDEKKDNQ
jgi:hypothetical protein